MFDKDILCRYQFPNPIEADPDGVGLIAVGGDLATDTLRYAYTHGMFPWFNEDEPIAWWSPDPRCLIYPETFTPSHSLKRRLKTCDWQISINQDFSNVIHACASIRQQQGTWINSAMIDAYNQLHQQGDAYSVEIWAENDLIGGLYGLKFGQAFFGESMFHRQTDASKVAFYCLMQLCRLSGFRWVDCQLPNNHLLSLGATTMPRQQFLTELSQQLSQKSCDWRPVLNQRFHVQNFTKAISYQPHQLTISTN